MGKKNRKPTSFIYKLFIYVALFTLAISIIVPVAWVFMASLKQNSEFIKLRKFLLGHYQRNFSSKTLL